MITHFVGTDITVSLIAVGPHESRVRVSRESDPDEYFDYNAVEWADLVSVIHMIDASLRHNMQVGVPQMLGMLQFPIGRMGQDLGEDTDTGNLDG